MSFIIEVKSGVVVVYLKLPAGREKLAEFFTSNAVTLSRKFIEMMKNNS